MEIASDKLSQIMNIPLDAQGFSEREFSGVALQTKNRQVLIANEYLFDNMDEGKRILAKKVIKLVQEHYTDERLRRLLTNSRPVDEDDQQQIQITEQEIDFFLAARATVMVSADCCLIHAGDQSRAASGAYWCCDVSILKDCSFSGKSIDMWCFYGFFALETEVA